MRGRGGRARGVCERARRSARVGGVAGNVEALVGRGTHLGRTPTIGAVATPAVTAKPAMVM